MARKQTPASAAAADQVPEEKSSTPPVTPKKRNKKQPSSVKQDEEPSTPVPTAETTSQPLSASAKKKVVDLEKAWGETPFPKLNRPTPKDCQEVYDLLCSVHGVPQRPTVLVDKKGAPAGCGEVPSVLDAVVRTILSQNTTSKNSTAAKNAMDAEYGRADYRAVLKGGVDKLAKVIQCGGLAQTKSKAIFKILERLDEREGGKGSLSLDYLHGMSDYKAMEELVSFDLVGIKTAACVLLFCLGRDCFAVDTHVHRLSMSLGWIPPSATRDQAFFHLDKRIPDQLKYGLHTQLVRHGRGCFKCSANGVTSMNHVDTCPIRHLVGKKSGKQSKKANIDDDEGDVKPGNGSKKVKKKDENELGIEDEKASEGRRKSPRKRGQRITFKEDSSSEEDEESEEDVNRQPKKVKHEKDDFHGLSVALDEAGMSGILGGLVNA
ncbi:hypothetical protein OIV83_003765 [Microbotryomycetes sp. JL201]|nr:hypothetical protein OIV83_003765 [Microbotryomycetes sp. JL201]